MKPTTQKEKEKITKKINKVEKKAPTRTTRKTVDTKKPEIKKEPTIKKEKIEINNNITEKRPIYNKPTISFNLVEIVSVILFTAVITCIVTSIIVFKNYDKIASSDYINTSSNDKELKEFTRAYNNILDSYVEKVDKEELIKAAIEGMYNSLDDSYTTYMDKSVSDDLKEQLVGEYEGIGVQITKAEDNNILISDVFEGSTAYEAGLKPGDIITHIDGESVKESTLEESSTKIKSSKTSEITYLRDGVEKKVTLEIKLVQIPSVKSENFDGVGYLYISTFAKPTYRQFKTKLEELENQEIKSLVIDLRGNTGGYLSTAKDISELFLEKGKKIYGLQYRDEKASYTKDDTVESRNYKIVVLINSASASASEILASALKESYGATIIGTTSYGKGTVQETDDLEDGSMLKYTTAYWLTPSGESINKKGITPDIEVQLQEYEEYSYEVDNQLQEAIKVIK